MTTTALNEAPTLSPINQVLELARVAFEAEMQGTMERAAKIKSAADAYVRAVEVTIAADIARRVGVESPGGSAHEAAAGALRDLVLDLPELRVVEHGGSGESTGAKNATPVVGTTRPCTDFESYEASPEAKALLEEVYKLAASDCSTAIFKAWASELTALARILQEKRDEAEDIPGRVIRKLNAMRCARGITGIFGLARDHQGNWEELAGQARMERERLQSRQNGLTHKLSIPESIVQRVEARPSSSPGGAIPWDDSQVEDLPRLRAASKVLPVVLVGGLVVNEKLELLRKRFGITPEWIETESGVKGVMSLETRIRERNVSAVVVLDGLISHKHFEPIVAATRQTGIPLAYGATAGIGALSKAFMEIEEKLQGGFKP